MVRFFLKKDYITFLSFNGILFVSITVLPSWFDVLLTKMNGVLTAGAY